MRNQARGRSQLEGAGEIACEVQADGVREKGPKGETKSANREGGVMQEKGRGWLLPKWGASFWVTLRSRGWERDA